MNYFKALGILFGLAAMLKPVYMHLLPWDENKFLAKTYSEKRPAWLVPVAVFGLLLVALTWYVELTTNVNYSMVITIIFSLTAIKALLFLFDYKKFYNWLQRKLREDSGKKIVIVDIWAGALGLIVVVTSIVIF